MHGEDLLEPLRPTLLGADLKSPPPTAQTTYTQLDNGASTPTFLPIWQAARRTWQTSDEVQAELVTKVKGICADFFHAPLDEYETIFTSNTTEAINLAELLLPVHGTHETPKIIINTI